MAGIEIDGARSLVTGAGNGIGRATALALAARRGRVACVDIDLSAAEKTAAECEEAGGRASAHGVDVSDRDAVLALADSMSADGRPTSRSGGPLGPLDLLVNNAGVGLSGHFAATSLDDWDWILSVNLRGVITCCHAFSPPMLAAGRGHVVNISSALGYTPRATESAYVTTKAAVLALSRCLRADWHDRGVGVSAVCPGIINTGIIERTRFLGEAGHDRVKAERTFRRGHSPDRVAAAIITAAERDRAVVPVGWEAHLGWWFSRLGPVSLQQVVARHQPFSIEEKTP